ncbi:helix-turn-helix domain-containing protein [Caloramator australicus]|uniref:HTH cro/C1-type domain-containing protein n=1 Tax=Caloramator australicus RC3 TaxID=857293 RepID=I7LK80_9CLOT|nr:helix-turn-helix transcriptional regulator [Caloramator australicus]CCJ34258.1 hypothetical protein CAAU_2174 [Caloramator australicus RC3]
MDLCPKCNSNIKKEKIYLKENKKLIEVYTCEKCGYRYMPDDRFEEILSYLKYSKIDYNAIIREEFSNYVVISRVKEIRKNRGIKLKELAQRLGVSSQRMYQIETMGENLTIVNALKLAKALNCEVGELFQLVKKDELTSDMVIVKKLEN